MKIARRKPGPRTKLQLVGEYSEIDTARVGDEIVRVGFYGAGDSLSTCDKVQIEMTASEAEWLVARLNAVLSTRTR